MERNNWNSYWAAAAGKPSVAALVIFQSRLKPATDSCAQPPRTTRERINELAID